MSDKSQKLNTETDVQPFYSCKTNSRLQIDSVCLVVCLRVLYL